MKLAELNPTYETFEADCEAVAAQFIAEAGEPRLNAVRHRTLIMASVRHLARTATPEQRRDAWGAIFDAFVILPYTDPALAHLCSDVTELKAAGVDHELFHVSSEMPVEEIKRLNKGNAWLRP